MNTSTDIYEYLDYRKYLSDWRCTGRKKDSSFTHENICLSLGQNNRSYFSDIEKGRKIIGSEVLDRLIDLIGLGKNESSYFRALVGYGQAGSYSEEEFWFEKLMELNKAPRQHLSHEKFSYFKEWYHSVIRAYLDTIEFRKDYSQLVSGLYNRITHEEAVESIALLEKLNLISLNEKGIYKPTDKVLSTGDDVRHECIKAYNVSTNSILHSILQKGDPGTHNSSLLTVSVSPKGLGQIERKIHSLRQEIMAIAHKDEIQAEGVFQVAIHAYPLCRQEKIR